MGLSRVSFFDADAMPFGWVRRFGWVPKPHHLGITQQAGTIRKYDIYILLSARSGAEIAVRFSYGLTGGGNFCDRSCRCYGVKNSTVRERERARESEKPFRDSAAPIPIDARRVKSALPEYIDVAGDWGCAGCNPKASGRVTYRFLNTLAAARSGAKITAR